MRRPRTPGQMVHSVSATDLEWERVRERADTAGLSISRYLVERALTVELIAVSDGLCQARLVGGEPGSAGKRGRSRTRSGPNSSV